MDGQKDFWGKPGEGLKQAQDGAQRAARHADAIHGDWQGQARAALLAFRTRAGDGFSSEQVREFAENVLGVPLPPDPRAWGHVMSSAAREHVITKTGRVIKCQRAAVHGSYTTEWCFAPATLEGTP